MQTAPLVLKENHLQIVTDQQGDIPPGNDNGFGLYYFDTRYLSAFEVLINGQPPLYLSHAAERDYIATFQYVNPPYPLPDGMVAPRQSISIRRSRFVDGRAFRERVGLYNCNHFPVDIDLTLRFEADFRDMLAIRGFCRQRLAARTTSRFGPEGLEFSYVGRDNVARHTLIRFSEQPEPISSNIMLFHLRLEPHQPASISLSVRPSTGRRKPVKAVGFDNALDRLIRSYKQWHLDSTALTTDNDFFDQSLLRQSQYDIRALIESEERDPNGKTGHQPDIVPAAGLPWYAVPFGRDSIITALQTIAYNPEIALGTLRFLARHQGDEENPVTEEQPGKILHELRRGELANLREIPHLPYYGTVDATSLFVILFVEAMAWVGSAELYRELLPHALRAIEWADRYG
ncbi:MAG: amylo-alpha-1,6-glucosidase, partial [Chloroflexota bacterium]|nr:amylo-alpha-1,6-glucosidase [Chloroflexota bacterium]